MIFGSFAPSTTTADGASPWKAWGIEDESALQGHWHDAAFTLGMTSSGAPSHDAGHSLFHSDSDDVTIAIYGTIFNAATLAKELGAEMNGHPSSEVGKILHAAYRKQGLGMFRQLNGNFVIVIHDRKQDRLWIARDHLGIESLFYYRRGDRLVFSSKLHSLARHREVRTDLNPTAVLRYFLFNYNPAGDTFYNNVFKLRPGSVLRIENNKLMIDPYWFISFKNPFDKSLATYREELQELFRDAIKIRLNAQHFRTGAYLSGGMDSSTVVGLMRPMLEGPIHTFSFRCLGKSYDESEYARLMSQRYNTSHHEVPYEPEDVHRIVQLAGVCNEPFSDIGIEVASFLLAEKAAGTVDYVLTGDGGDELFGGHPVYLADRMAERFGKIPGLLRNPLTNLLQKLPDTDQKKSLVVKAKRFSYSAGFPADLFSNRWRIYYTEDELRRLLHPDWLAQCNLAEPLEEIRNVYHEADGADFLSKTLYGDYYTVVGFYLNRMELVRHFGLEGRFPLLDYRLVEYTARIPSHLKISKKGETKHIFHQVMAGTLPDEIVFRKDKLGHSVPFKNWLRETAPVQKLLQEYLSDETLQKRQFFNAGFVRQMYDRHMSRTDNNSHRLWALLVFELWCRHNLDGEEVAELPAVKTSA